MILVGELALWVALLVSAWATTVSFAGGAQQRDDLIASGERGVHAALAMTLLASLGLGTALVTRDFSLTHVAGNTSANLPLAYTLAALWAGPAGSLLFLTLLISACAFAAVRGGGRSRGSLSPYATGALGAVVSFHLAALCLDVNPYARLDWEALDGLGMAPVLQHPGMALHPPALYLGLAMTSVPFAKAIAAVLTKQLSGQWVTSGRRWTLAAWLFLTTGIVLGMWWAYGEPAAEAHWTRDAISNGSLAPWLACTLLLAVLYEGRDTLHRWHVALMLTAFPLAVVTLLVPGGGMIAEVHSLAASPARSWLAGFLVLVIAGTTYLTLSRLLVAEEESGPRRRGWRQTRLLSRSAVAAWIVGAGALLVTIGLIGAGFRATHLVTVSPGAPVTLNDPFGRAWRFSALGVSRYNELNRRVVAAAVVVSYGGSTRGTVNAGQMQHVNSRGTPAGEPSLSPGLIRTALEDVYVVLREVGDDERATVQIDFNPMVSWVWAGGLLLVIGGSLALAGAVRRRKE